MTQQRQFRIDQHFQPSQGEEPLRSVVTESAHSVVVAWHVLPGQSIALHRHPNGQDTWVILSGTGHYQCDEKGTVLTIGAGDLLVARAGELHGVTCTSVEPLRFISVVADREAGYERWPFADV